jgi:DNA segregation ATPase FtsK/SpoIIIE, S-DNA-T family
MPFFIPGIRALWGHRGKEQTAAAASDRDEPPDARREESVPPSSESASSKRNARTYAREAAALLLMASGLYCALALASYEADPLRPEIGGENWVGPVGEVFARIAVELVGIVSWLLPLELVLIARPLLRDRKVQLDLARLSGDVVMAVILAGLAHIAFPRVMAFGAMPFGGVVGDLFGEVLQGLFSTVGSFLIGLTVVSLILVERATFSFIEVAQRALVWLSGLRGRLRGGLGTVSEAWVRARDVERRRREEEHLSEPSIVSPEQADAIIAAFADDGDGDGPTFVRAPRFLEEEPPERDGPPAEIVHETPTPVRASVVELGGSGTVERGVVEPPPHDPAEDRSEGADELLEAAAEPPSRPRKRRKKKDQEPTIVDTSKAAETRKAHAPQKSEDTAFELPGPELLDAARAGGVRHDPEQLKETARLLEKTLLDYRVEGKVQEIHPGPTVTMFEVSPAPGTKVSKVASLADDLALGLSRKVRIVAPIPGKNRIGFEVPNEKRIPVNLRELVESEDFVKLSAPLPCVLGRDGIGRPFFADLASMPHVIVAGATGAGKSVGLNVMLVSLLYRKTPEQLRMLMIDPKVVELAPFDRIPHLLFPVVTDMKQASNALKWAVDEMERRYQLFADAGTKNITTYNKWVKKVRAGDLPAPRPKMVEALAPDGTQIEIPAAKFGSDGVMPDKIPYIVVVVEEFADLIMTQGKEVEASVARLAQKARAAGIHVILATQRPSVDVITGMIKANFPTRIAFRVAQRVDSRTILDQQGAEALLGMGDMLVKINGATDVRRVQCPFVSEDEVQRVTDMLRSQGEPEYDESIVRCRDEEPGEGDDADGESDPLYDQAVRVVAETGKCSTSWLQRKLGVGYNRAAKIVETMEKNGVVGPPNGSKPREILIGAI